MGEREERNGIREGDEEKVLPFLWTQSSCAAVVCMCVLCLCSKLRHIVDEMVTTEREYVRSLRYIIHHYFPEMDRADLPQDLRGKRSVVFGNLEKLLDFHSQFFLRELESCCKHPLRVPHCFLRHVGHTLTHTYKQTTTVHQLKCKLNGSISDNMKAVNWSCYLERIFVNLEKSKTLMTLNWTQGWSWGWGSSC